MVEVVAAAEVAVEDMAQAEVEAVEVTRGKLTVRSKVKGAVADVAKTTKERSAQPVASNVITVTVTATSRQFAGRRRLSKVKSSKVLKVVPQAVQSTAFGSTIIMK